MEDWEKDYTTGFLKITEGEHTLEVLGAPVKDQSKFNGKDQWVFPAKLDGMEGKLVPPKGLGKIIAGIHKGKGVFPVVFKFSRSGLDLKTVFRLV